MAEPIWGPKRFRGEIVEIFLEDLTVQRLREIKSVFGTDYGIPAQFAMLLGMGESDAVTAALWINGQKTGQPIGDMLAFDFNPTEFENVTRPKRAAGKQRGPQKAGTGDETSSSETPTSSEDDSSSS